MKNILFILLIISSIKECQLTKNEQKLDLSNGKLENFDYDSNKYINITYLDLSNNSLKNIPDFVFEIKELSNLNLTENKFDKIPNEITKLKNLHSLNFKDNSIKEISSYVECLKELKLLILINNPIAVEDYDRGKCFVNDSCTIIISNEFVEHPPYCKE